MGEESCRITVVDEKKVAKVKERMSPVEALNHLAETFRVLGDLSRVRILHALSLEELCVCDLASLLGSSQSAVSHQLRLLRASRLVKTRKEGKMVYYSLDDDHVRRLISDGLVHVQED